MFQDPVRTSADIPDHKIQITPSNGNAPLWGHISRRAIADRTGSRSLLLLQVTPTLLASLTPQCRRDYADFQKVVTAHRRKTAIASAKSLAVKIVGGEEIHRAALAVYYFGVIPVYELGITVGIDYRGISNMKFDIALVPDFPSDTKHEPAADPELPIGSQFKLFRAPGEPSDFLLVTQGYCIDCFSVLESYLEEVGNLCRVLMDRTSGRKLFQKAGSIKELITERIGIKLGHLRESITSTKRLDAEEVNQARALVAQNREAILLGEMACYLIHHIIARYMRLFDIGFDVVNARSPSLMGFAKDLAPRWQIPEEEFEHIVETNALLSFLHQACSEPTELLNQSIEGLEQFRWISDLRDLFARVRFLEDEGFSLSTCNVFLSHRSGSRLTAQLLAEANPIDGRRIKLHTYRRRGPGEHEFAAEIEWYIWACLSFVSHMSGEELNRGEGLDWIVRELDLAVLQQKKGIAVIRENVIDLRKVAELIRRSDIALPQVGAVPGKKRLGMIADQLDIDRHLHFEYALEDPELISGVLENVRDWLNERSLFSAEAFFLGWLTLFSPTTQRVIAHVCSLKRNRAILFKTELEEKLDLDERALSEVRLNLAKYPAFVSGRETTIVGFERSRQGSGSPFIYRSQFGTIARGLFPGVDVHWLLQRVFDATHAFRGQKPVRRRRS